ncbi:MAG: LysR family transcriptional regulator [Litorimonas sp.]
MQNWDDHRLILAIFRAGTLRAAAEALGVTHTTVARRLAAVEASEASPVFVKSGRSYSISDYGRQRVAVAERIEALHFEAQRLRQGSSQTLSGPLSLSVPRAFLQFTDLMETVAAFSRAYPEVDLTIAPSDSLADLDRGQADVVLRGQIGPDPHLVGRLVSPIGLNFYAQRAYLESRAPEDYEWISAPLARQDGISSPPAWLAGSPYPDGRIGLIVDDIVLRHKAVADGLGLGRLACFMAADDPRLVRIGASAPVHAYDLWILTHPDLHGAPKIGAMMEWLWNGLRPKRPVLDGSDGA